MLWNGNNWRIGKTFQTVLGQMKKTVVSTSNSFSFFKYRQTDQKVCFCCFCTAMSTTWPKITCHPLLVIIRQVDKIPQEKLNTVLCISNNNYLSSFSEWNSVVKRKFKINSRFNSDLIPDYGFSTCSKVTISYSWPANPD